MGMRSRQSQVQLVLYLDLVEQMRVVQQVDHVGQVRPHTVHGAARQLARVVCGELATRQLRRQHQATAVPCSNIRFNPWFPRS